jgi:hypothetical protein
LQYLGQSVQRILLLSVGSHHFAKTFFIASSNKNYHKTSK